MIKKIILFAFTIASFRQFAQKKNELVYNTDTPPPVILYHSLLNYVKSINVTGIYALRGINALFLPVKDIKGKDVNYGAYSPKEARIHVTITKDGQPFFHKLSFTAESNGVQAVMDIVDQGNDLHRNPPPPFTDGKYLLEFFLDDKKFYEFEFKIVKQTIDDVYAAVKACYLVHGPWDELGFISFDDANVVNFTMYIQTETMTKKECEEHFIEKLTTDLYKDGKLIATMTNPKKQRDINREWGDYINTFNFPGGGYHPVKKEDLTDGKYEIKVIAGGANLLFPFEVKNGQIKLLPQQDRAIYKDPFTLIEGKNTKFFIKNATGNSTTINIQTKK